MATLIPLLVSLLVLSSIPAQSAVFNISPGDVTGLIAAMNTANSNGEENTINLAPGTYTLTAFDNFAGGLGGNGLPSVIGKITIKGSGAESTTIERDPGAPPFRIFHVQLTGTLILDGITVRGGESRAPGPDRGGGLHSFGGTVEIHNSRFIGNSTTSEGGAVDNLTGSLKISNSTFTDNTAFIAGALRNGGVAIISNSIFSHNTGRSGAGAISHGSGSGQVSLRIENSTISENRSFDLQAGGVQISAGTVEITNSSIWGNSVGIEGSTVPNSGGGIYNRGQLLLTNSTVAGNTAVGAAAVSGAGIFNASTGTMTITNSTIVGNATAGENPSSIASGGGIANSSGSVSLQNTILALNDVSVGDGRGNDCSGTVISLGNNLIGDPVDCVIQLQPSDLTGDPMLADFVDDGTPGTGHFPLLPGSPAIDAGNTEACSPTDQLGQARVGTCDIGAVEFGSSGAAFVVDVDVSPGNRHNNINPNSNARVSIALLSSGSFDAATVDRHSVRFGPNQIPADGPGKLKDVNHDKRRDLLLQFRVRNSGIQCGDTSVSVSGRTVDGTPFEASDSITTVGCKPKKPKPK